MSMDGTAGSSQDADAIQVGPFPKGLSAGSTVLVAGAVEPAKYAVTLRALAHFGGADDTGLVVTTTENAEQTGQRYDIICQDAAGPALAFVDTTADRPSAASLYGDQPVVVIPAPGDLERLVIGLSDLTGNQPPASGTRHLAVRSLTPLLENASTADVCTILERVQGLRTGSGLTLFGLDYTAHDEATMSALIEHVDGILWVTEKAGEVEFEYNPASGRHALPMACNGSDE